MGTVFCTEIFFYTICTYVYTFIHITMHRFFLIFFNNFYAIATCFQKKSATRSPVRMHEYHATAFDSSLITYIERDVLRNN